jgi:4-hydroxy-tetrahydrodipicolinate synthase
MLDIVGCGTALVTPFDRDNRVDFESYSRFVEWQIDSGIDFLVPCGTTGESVTLKEHEYREVVAACVRSARGRVPVVAGAGSNDTEHATHLARIAQEAGADAVLSVTPYYNKPTQEGLFRHFQAIASSVDIPLVLYNVPGRTSVNLTSDTVLRLARNERIIAIKEASGNLVQIMEIIQGRPAGFRVLSGDDAVTLALSAMGGDGVISVASNLIPAEMTRMVALIRQGRLEEARELHYRFLTLMNLIFIEANPIPVKYALSRMGRIEEVYRLPLCSMADGNKRKVELELQHLNLTVCCA